MNGKELNVYLNNKLILTGPRNKVNKIWEVTFNGNFDTITDPSNAINTPSAKNITTHTMEHLLNNMYRLTMTSSVILYLHTVAFFPVKSTWLKAIKNNFYTTWPFLTYKAVNKYLPASTVTSRAHTRQEQENLCTTKVANRVTRTELKDYEMELMIKSETPINNKLETSEDTHPTMQQKSNDVIVRVEYTAKIYSDQTGVFSFLSSRGYRYILIAYDVDSNAIMAWPLKSKSHLK